MNERLVITAKPEDVEEDAKYRTLNESGFVRAESAAYQWYLLVTKACAQTKIPIDDMVRDYLAAMLYRFMGRSMLFEQLAAFDFYGRLVGAAKVEPGLVPDVADISLQYVAFFPEASLYRHQMRGAHQIADIGISLYRELARSAEGKNDWFSQAYALMATSFIRAVMVLRSTVPRFALRRRLAAERFRNEAMRFPSITEMRKLGPALQQFDLMYFRTEGSLQVPKNN